MYNNQTPNSNTLYAFGKSIMNLVIINIIELVVAIIALMMIYAPMLTIMNNPYADPESAIMRMLDGFTAVVVILAIVGVIYFIVYIQYILKMRAVANESSFDSIQKAYSFLVWSIVLTIIAVLIFVFSILGISDTILSTDDPYTIMSTLIGAISLAGIAFLIGLGLSVGSIIKLHNWSEDLIRTYGNSPALAEAEQGFNYYMIGTLIGIICSLGSFFALYGQYKAGKGLMAAFDPNSPGNINNYNQNFPSYVNSNQGNSYTTNPSNNNYGNTTYGNISVDSSMFDSNSRRISTTDSQNTSKPQKFCKMCGSSIPEMNAQFCPKCGARQD